MPIKHYKGLEICEMWENGKPYYIVCKEFKDDPFWEIRINAILYNKKS
jgi:hypothetical protein